MKSIKFICLFFLIEIFVLKIQAQPDSLKINKLQLSKYQIGVGFGFGAKGNISGINGAILFSNNFGASISYRYNTFKPDNLPLGYSKGAFEVFEPANHLNIISLSLIKNFISYPGKFKFGIEAGPSYDKYRYVTIVPNPKYNPNNWNTFLLRKFLKEENEKNSTGLSLKAKTELEMSKYASIEFTIFSNINSMQSFIGIEFYLNLIASKL